MRLYLSLPLCSPAPTTSVIREGMQPQGNGAEILTHGSEFPSMTIIQYSPKQMNREPERERESNFCTSLCQIPTVILDIQRQEQEGAKLAHVSTSASSMIIHSMAKQEVI